MCYTVVAKIVGRPVPYCRGGVVPVVAQKKPTIKKQFCWNLYFSIIMLAFMPVDTTLVVVSFHGMP